MSRHTTPLGPGGEQPPYRPGDHIIGGYYSQDDPPRLVQFCEFDTSDGDWFIVTTPTDHPLTDPDTAFTNYNHGVNPFGYEFEHRDRALPRCERVYSPPPITVPPLRSAAEAAQFLDSLLEDTDG